MRIPENGWGGRTLHPQTQELNKLQKREENMARHFTIKLLEIDNKEKNLQISQRKSDINTLRTEEQKYYHSPCYYSPCKGKILFTASFGKQPHHAYSSKTAEVHSCDRQPVACKAKYLLSIRYKKFPTSAPHATRYS